MRNKILTSVALITALAIAKPVIAEPTQTKPQTLFSKWKGGSCELTGTVLTVQRDGLEAKATTILDMPVNGSREHRKNGALALFCSEDAVQVLYPAVVELYGPPKRMVTSPDAVTSVSVGQDAVAGGFICDGRAAIVAFENTGYQILRFTQDDGVHELISMHKTDGIKTSKVLFGNAGNVAYLLFPEKKVFFAFFNICGDKPEIGTGVLPAENIVLDCSSGGCVVNDDAGKPHNLPLRLE